MTIKEYKSRAREFGFEEYPYVIAENEPSLKSLVEFDKADIDLKIYLTKLILCRNFSPAGGYEVFSDHIWLLEKFSMEFQQDLIKPWISNSIKEAFEMILNGDTFTKNIIATTFMFGVVEYYAKFLLGWKTGEDDFFDKDFHKKYRELSIGHAINRLKKQNTSLAKDLSEIDKYAIGRLKELNIKEESWVIATISDRLTIARNTMLHGENHSFHSIGKYLLSIYMLLHLHEVKKGNRKIETGDEDKLS